MIIDIDVSLKYKNKIALQDLQRVTDDWYTEHKKKWDNDVHTVIEKLMSNEPIVVRSR